MSQNLQYNYICYNTTTGEVLYVLTSSYVINMDGWLEVPVYEEDYQHKFYNFAGDQKFYHDAEFTRLWEECPSH